MPGQVQQLNDEKTTLDSSQYQMRYEPNFAWENACALMQALPALRAFWPCGAQIVTAQSLFISDIANNYNLTAIHTPVFGYEALRPYIDFDGANDYGYYLDNAQFDIIGNEAYVAQPGLTLGCWFYPDRVTGSNEYVLSKWSEAAPLSSSYRLIRHSTGALDFAAGSGAAYTRATSTLLIRQSVWQFIAGKFIPSTSVNCYLSTAVGTLTPTTQATAIATMLNSALDFRMAVDGAGANFFDGKISLAFVCASALSDTIINAIYQQTRALFGQ